MTVSTQHHVGPEKQRKVLGKSPCEVASGCGPMMTTGALLEAAALREEGGEGVVVASSPTTGQARSSGPQRDYHSHSLVSPRKEKASTGIHPIPTQSLAPEPTL